jgi:hypothetical protein
LTHGILAPGSGAIHKLIHDSSSFFYRFIRNVGQALTCF